MRILFNYYDCLDITHLAMIVAATDGNGVRNVNVPDTLGNLLPTLQNWQKDLPDCEDETHRVPVRAETLE